MASRVTVHVDDHWRLNVEHVAEKVKHRFGRKVAKDAARLAPRDTNLLSQLIAYHESESAVVADTDYAAAQEFGATEHLIANAFGYGEDFIVVHPGNVAQPYLRPAAYQHRDKL